MRNTIFRDDAPETTLRYRTTTSPSPVIYSTMVYLVTALIPKPPVKLYRLTPLFWTGNKPFVPPGNANKNRIPSADHLTNGIRFPNVPGLT